LKDSAHYLKRDFVKGGEMEIQSLIAQSKKSINIILTDEEIDDIRYYNKNQTSNSFKSFIENSNIDDPITGIHPSPEGHAIWAKELAEYITKHSLL
jgi:hypothetical protein